MQFESIWLWGAQPQGATPPPGQGSPASAPQGCLAGRLCLLTRSPCPRAITHCAHGVKHLPEPQPGVHPAPPAPPACPSLWGLSLGVPVGVSEESGPGDRAGHVGSLLLGTPHRQFLVLVPARGLRQCFPAFPPFPGFPAVVLGQAGGDPTPSRICHPPPLPLPWDTQLPPQLCLVPSMALAASSSPRLGHFPVLLV